MKFFDGQAFSETSADDEALHHIATLNDLLCASVAFDLEVSIQAEKSGFLRDAAAFPADIPLEEATKRKRMSARAVEEELRSRKFAIGHNAALHDVPELETLLGRKLDGLQIIDTLWLSPLAFPVLRSHALKKTYLDETSLADPVQDVLETVALFRSEMAALARMDPVTCHGIFPPPSIRVRPNLRTDNEANEIHRRADHRDSGGT